MFVDRFLSREQRGRWGAKHPGSQSSCGSEAPDGARGAPAAVLVLKKSMVAPPKY